VLERRPYQSPGERTRHEYHLTDEGRDFFPVLVALWQWGQRWLGPAAVDMRHHDCGAEVVAEVRCAAGHEVSIADIDLVPERRRS
jgi:hypothetical protein